MMRSSQVQAYKITPGKSHSEFKMNDVAYLAIENTLAVISLIFWTVQLLPQLYHQYKLHQLPENAKDLTQTLDDFNANAESSGEGRTDIAVRLIGDDVIDDECSSDDKKEIAWGMLFSWMISSALLNPFIAYVHLTIPLVLQAHAFTVLLVLMILQHVYYQAVDRRKIRSEAMQSSDEEMHQLGDNADQSREPMNVKPSRFNFSPWNSVALTATLLIIVLVLSEVGLYYALDATQDPAQEGWHTFLIYLTSIFPSIMILAGFVPQILLIIKAKSTKTLSRFFVWFDFLGGVFGLASLSMSAKHRPPGDTEIWYSSALYIGVMTGHVVFMVLIVKYDGFRALVPTRQKAA